MKVTKEKLSSVWKDAVHDTGMTEEVFWENEIKANQLIAKAMIAAAAMLVVFWILNSEGVLAISRIYAVLIFPVGIAALSLPACIGLKYYGEKSFVKYMLLISLTVTLAYLDGILTFNAPLLIVLPVVFSCRYYSCSITIRTALLTTILFAVSAWSGAVFNFHNPDMNFANDDMSIYVHDVMTLSFLPRWMTFAVFAAFCYAIAKYGRNMVLKQNEISQKAAKVSTELEMASNIQNGALPDVKSLSENRFRKFDLSAKMTPAKEVGGDFYDFFYPDESHLAMIIADVADKGVAASLFMMMSKTILGSTICNKPAPGRVLETVNNQLYANSPKGMFVTVWLGILNLKTGELVTANAGHEYPALCRRGGEFELVKDKHGFVLGGMDDMIYKETTYQLEPGDTIFVYTDGVPEANDSNCEMFGTERMLNSLNRYRNEDMNGLVEGVKKDIDDFISGAPQFDDTTMLAFQLQDKLLMDEIMVEPVTEEMETIKKHILDVIGSENIDDTQEKKMCYAVDEAFSNIVKYSGAKHVWTFCEAENDRIRVILKDDGMPFNPLEGEDSPILVPGKNSRLGTWIMKNMVDSIGYEYKDGLNVLTLISFTRE